MSIRYTFGCWALLVILFACGGAEGETGADLEFLGAYITPTPGGGVLECTNYYGDPDENLPRNLQMVLNREEPCPEASALGSCLMPSSSFDGVMTSNEMVYYISEVPADQYDALEDGDECNGNGVWREPYLTTPPDNFPSVEDNDDSPAGSGGPEPTSTRPTNTLAFTIRGDTTSGIGTVEGEAEGPATRNGVIFATNERIPVDGKEYGITVQAGPFIGAPFSLSSDSVETVQFVLSLTIDGVSAHHCGVVILSGDSMVVGNYNFEVASVPTVYQHDSMSEKFYEVHGSGHAECSHFGHAEAGLVTVDMTF